MSDGIITDRLLAARKLLSKTDEKGQRICLEKEVEKHLHRRIEEWDRKKLKSGPMHEGYFEEGRKHPADFLRKKRRKDATCIVIEESKNTLGIILGPGPAGESLIFVEERIVRRFS